MQKNLKNLFIIYPTQTLRLVSKAIRVYNSKIKLPSSMSNTVFLPDILSTADSIMKVFSGHMASDTGSSLCFK